MNRTACMGGWCGQRATCAHHLATHRPAVAERLCQPGQLDAYQPAADLQLKPQMFPIRATFFVASH